MSTTYPASKQTFTDHIDNDSGDLIDAGDVNPIQDTVEELEDGLGYGATTLGDQFDSDSFVRSGSKTKPLFVGAKATLAATQNVVNTGTWTQVNLDTEIYDIGSNFNVATTYDFTAPVAGYYLIIGSIRWQTTKATFKYITAVALNNSLAVPFITGEIQAVTTSSLLTVACSDVRHLDAGDILELWGQHNDGTANPDFFGDGNGAQTYLMVTLIAKD